MNYKDLAKEVWLASLHLPLSDEPHKAKPDSANKNIRCPVRLEL